MISASADRALGMFRTPRKSVAPVRANARAVSIPMPDEQPVMRITFEWSEVGVRFWAWIICFAVGWVVSLDMRMDAGVMVMVV